jgi:transcriptional regulator with XRE-family HTH domain
MVRRQLGRKLRQLREACGKTREDVVATRLLSRGKLQSIENGSTMVRPGDAYELGRLYGASAEELETLRAMAAGTNEAGWWQEYSDGVLKGFEVYYLALESAAERIASYEPAVLPGLLQTEAYALAVDRATAAPGLDEEGIRGHVRLRLRRLPMLLERDEPPQMRLVLGEAALQLRVGGDEVMAGQLAHLDEVAALPTVTVKVLTHAAGPHPALVGPFTVLDFEDEADPSVAYVESCLGARYDDRQGPVLQLRTIFEAIDQVATPLEEYRA